MYNWCDNIKKKKMKDEEGLRSNWILPDLSGCMGKNHPSPSSGILQDYRTKTIRKLKKKLTSIQWDRV